MPTNSDFANYCCDLLASIGRYTPKRMANDLSISIYGLTIAILVDLKDCEKLWLKGDDSTRDIY